jgi:hypothetical protein
MVLTSEKKPDPPDLENSSKSPGIIKSSEFFLHGWLKSSTTENVDVKNYFF